MEIKLPAMLGILFALAIPAGAEAQEFTLKLHHFLGPNTPSQTEMLEPWAKNIEEASGGRVKIEIFPSMVLGGTPPELAGQVRDGVVDMIWTVNGYTPGLFPRTEVFELPFIHTNDIRATNLAMAEMFDEYLADDYRGVRVMFLHVHAGQAIQTGKTEVRAPADLRGMKMRIPTRTGAWVIEALGAAPASMPVPDLPQALAKGVVDGALIPFEIIPSLGLEDQTTFQIEGAEGVRFGNTTFQLSMNLDRWNSLPTDIQRVFVENSGPLWLEDLAAVWRTTEDKGIKKATGAGNIHIELTAGQTDAFRKVLEPVIDRWIADVAGKGIDGQGLVDMARDRIAAHTAI